MSDESTREGGRARPDPARGGPDPARAPDPDGPEEAAGGGRPGGDGGRSDADRRASPGRLEAHVRALEGERHPHASPDALEAGLGYAEDALSACGHGPERRSFTYEGRVYENLVASLPAHDPDAPRVLIGAHVDTVRGSPGADDNASGVAAVLECARLLRGARFRAPVELAVFNLEEQQGLTYRVGSRRFTARAREEGVDYAAGLVFEMVGYTTPEGEAQQIPRLLRWKDVPDSGDWVAAVGDWKSKDAIRAFRKGAEDAAPDLRVVTHRTPFRGWLVWQTRLSDNASFWSEGYPALMITDTAFLRNPHYHRASDRADTLDYDFMARVVDATVAAAERLAGGRVGGGGQSGEGAEGRPTA